MRDVLLLAINQCHVDGAPRAVFQVVVFGKRLKLINKGWEGGRGARGKTKGERREEREDKYLSAAVYLDVSEREGVPCTLGVHEGMHMLGCK